MGIAADVMERNLRERLRERLPMVTDLIVDDTKAACSRLTGALADSVQADPWAENGNRYSTIVSAGRGLPNPDVARFQDEGTGVFGPGGQPIRPTNGMFLVFTSHAAASAKNPTGIVFAREVQGSEPTHFFDGGPGGRMEARFRSATLAAFA